VMIKNVKARLCIVSFVEQETRRGIVPTTILKVRTERMTD